MTASIEQRDIIAQEYFELLPFAPYPVQEEALLSWFTESQGVLVCAPTGTGKTLIAEAAIFEALKLGKTAYYTTPLIALTDQKFRELQESVASWGFSPREVGLVTGNRKVNPDAKIQVVVAEILLNRLLHSQAFDFQHVWAVVMDEFHSFNDPERGIVWEFGLGLLPDTVKTLLLSATVGNALEFVNWLKFRHQRNLKLVSSSERKVPLTYRWVGDTILPDFMEEIVKGDESARRTPALVFCFNREQCWTLAEQLKGKRVIDAEQQRVLAQQLEQYDWSQGAGPKLKQILIRGIGVHHAGVLPKYRRIVESLFQQKLLSICVCTETLAAGINLPARSVVLPTLLKGPPGKMKLIDPSSAHQMFGRAGRPQYDDQGFVFALAHEDDVKILRWQEKFDQIPADTKDPGLLKAKKQLKKKQPKRSDTVQYWDENQFHRLIVAPPVNLESKGDFPWRLLVYMIDQSPDVDLLRRLVDKRLLQGKKAEQAQKQLLQMLIVLHRSGYVELEPKPPLAEIDKLSAAINDSAKPKVDGNERSTGKAASDNNPEQINATEGLFSAALRTSRQPTRATETMRLPIGKTPSVASEGPVAPSYFPERAVATERLPDLLKLRGVHPLYAMFLLNHMGIADRSERLQAMESLLELPGSIGKAIRVPDHDTLPPGPLATTRLDEQLLRLGLATAAELRVLEPDDEQSQPGWSDDERVYVLTLAHKLHRLFEYDFPGVHDVRVWPCWVAGELLNYQGDFNKYITSNGLQKQEGMIFRHLLRLVLLIDEFAMLCPPDIEHRVWQDDLGTIADQLETSCRDVDPDSTEQWLEQARTQIDE
ncbi:MAG TPA: DEAD/DEAH box helicase [Pirellulaceae bacterium]|nr:DEAD/DEAH box helicase [Pirellulaceae bacterium]HMP68603.1 DEAD/DEAH box helicase [Pirellulaceae bacterium]